MAIHLICPCGLPTLVLANLEVNKIVDFDEKPMDYKKNRKSYEVSRKCQSAWATSLN